MWGIRTLSTTAILDARLIPAHAGNTSRSFFLNSCSWTHPRARGEYQEFANKVQELWGSSPRTRGILTAEGAQPLREGLIPAHAGNTDQICFLANHQRAHPRARGEYFRRPSSRVVCRGSSPRTRGIQLSEADTKHPMRLIPAHAGNTLADQHRNNHYTRFSFNLSKSIDLSGKEILLCLYNLKYVLFSNCQFHINDDKWEIKNKK